MSKRRLRNQLFQNLTSIQISLEKQAFLLGIHRWASEPVSVSNRSVGGWARRWHISHSCNFPVFCNGLCVRVASQSGEKPDKLPAKKKKVKQLVVISFFPTQTHMDVIIVDARWDRQQGVNVPFVLFVIASCLFYSSLFLLLLTTNFKLQRGGFRCGVAVN